MADEKRTVEVSGVDVDAAIAKGLSRLGVSRERVDIEVLDRGSRGLLGLGSREAVVRLTLKQAAPTPPAAPKAPPAKPQPPPAKPQPPPAKPAETRVQPVTRPEPAPEPPAKPKAPAAQPPAPPAPPAEPEQVAGLVGEEHAGEVAAALDKVRTLLAKMQVEATVTARLSEKDERTGRQLPIVEIEGDDLSVLIGARGETLQALQFVTRLMVGHAIRQRTNLVIDVAGYRQRREQALSKLAERMARKVIKRGRPVTLEPMPPNERRLVHIALRDNEAVYTQSTGEGNRRRVRIYPSK